MGRSQSRREEIANTLTHAIGIGLAVAALAVIVVVASLHGDAWRVVSLSVFGATLVGVYVASTLYHGARHPRLKRLFRVLDHSAILLLIAGTYTPVTLVFLPGALGWVLFGLIWGLAGIGLLVRLAWARHWRRIALPLYLAMGWLSVVILRPGQEALPGGLIAWLLIGGLCYTAGVGFYGWTRLRYHHAIWHLFVLAGSICHWFGMLWFAARA